MPVPTATSAASGAGRGTLWWVAAMAVGALVLLQASAGGAASSLGAAAEAGAYAVLLGAALGAAHRSGGRLGWAWRLVAVSPTVLLATALVDLVAPPSLVPTDQLAGAARALAHGVSLAGLALLVPASLPWRAATRVALDALVAALSVSFMLWAVAGQPPGGGLQAAALVLASATAAGVLAALLLVGALHAWGVPSWYRWAYWGMAAALAGGVVEAVAGMGPGAPASHAFAAGTAAGAVLWTVAAARCRPWTERAQARQSAFVQTMPYVPFGVAVVVAVWVYVERGGLEPVLFAVAVANVLVVAIRTVLSLEENRRLTERVEASDAFKTQLLRFISHEIANPLSPLALQVGLLRAGKGDPAKAWPIVQRSIDRLESLSRDVRLMSLADSQLLVQQVRPTDLRPRVLDAVAAYHDLARAGDVRLEADMGDGPVVAAVDPPRFDQVVDNLLSNALKFTPAGGEVVVVLRRGDAQATLEVRDTGVGLTPEQRRDLFAAFGRAHGDQPGLGLGLYLCKAIVEAHGGRLTVRSAGTGQGTTFVVALPTVSANPAQGRPLPGEGPAGGAGRVPF